ncbi:MBL fold metallo-hydrolase [Nocardioides sp. NPDC051685]|uniref:MBL fold metallo-hydrolase n=1 Tax=Nocardioides sp. NPDC051685 TaxID=3364334 RepID=UPI003793DA03
MEVDVYTCDAVDLPRGGTFSPTTCSLILGENEAVLVDTQYRAADVDEVIQRIDTSGRTLTTIFVTHGHFDHYFGLEMLLERYPAARAVATPAVAAHIARNIVAERASAARFFEGQALDNTVVPEPLAGGALWVDESELRVIDLEQADIAPTSIVHIPSIDTVIAGDAIYNGVNPFLAASGPDDWPKWVASVGRIAGLEPTTVIAGHKSPARSDGAECIEETRHYLASFIDLFETCSDSRELVSRMTDLYPDHVNPSALVMSAVTAFKQKTRPEG